MCLMNRLSDSGSEVDAAEDAVLLFEGNEEKASDLQDFISPFLDMLPPVQAKQYLKLLEQFQELGFEPSKIKDALCSSKLDEEKTLDLLTGT